ncbi:TIGR01620 family protein [Neptunomonas antarctica]|uniref:Putative membrane protein n=1 Tax=Neptunomonas antarctica TaxID=619304 RepID=A0A1N7IWQ8_9GAMM|nr:TIGR01620 family protein [Neptunomonas antarctica]SIS41421.1 putative membrane protein [Neptunomonas antarctica]
MSDKPHWKEPVFINPDNLNTDKAAESETPDAQEIPLHAVSLVAEEQDDSQNVDKLSPAPKKRRWANVFTASIITLLSAGVIGEVYRLINWGFETHLVLGVTFAALTSITAISGVVWTWKGLKGLRQLKQTEALHAEAQALRGQKTHGQAISLLKKLDSYYENTPINRSFKEALRQVDSAYNDGEIIHYISNHALKEQDEAARRCVHRYSVQSGIMVALSPYATFDMWLVGWRNLKMLREITDIYGISPGATTQWSLLKKVLHNIAFAGLSEMTIHAGSQILSSSLTASISARAGQGIGAGLFTARSGLQAIRLCRPLPQENNDQRLLSAITQSIISDIKG